MVEEERFYSGCGVIRHTSNRLPNLKIKEQKKVCWVFCKEGYWGR